MSVQVNQVAGRIGAEVSRIRLSGDLDDREVRLIRASLLRHRVLFFRGQHHLDQDGQVAFARLLGPLTPTRPAERVIGGNVHIADLDYSDGRRGDRWRTDGTYTERPPLASVARALEVPPAGGDTLWANTVAAYEDCPQELRVLAERLRAVHTNRFELAWDADPDWAPAETEHPVVRVHPETGEHAILLGGYARSLAGLSKETSEALIRLLQEQVVRAENTVRWRWAPGDVAVWDNRATQHRVIHDFGDRRRRLHQVGVAGEAPVAVDGGRSVPVADETPYHTHAAAA
ncbi:TauD/TfdA dioxygenase family protein [Rhizohabitans arisaemae]|uniref:TauD/TfdA dioxygenase family protein n=1 Tax=Rhizohabitans arisaemae TaxID=2720610 RepID=UPI0024B04CD5|nr:TauD/TfdA family dioxygenase [Rhizohabitans arisaemae]